MTAWKPRLSAWLRAASAISSLSTSLQMRAVSSFGLGVSGSSAAKNLRTDAGNRSINP